ncbi:cysteine and histidine-rich domain-containing protein 1-like [Dreissena polymorpha]|uniref:Cysteine and histidine-rich domain-containing protein 1 n=1 Tax=Dreissena polymorpha TaxID=45954 RepID=A0A9D4HQT3_DREPO|nr:cysteine and histidine-rich domain-containing protein 1-like [Dreissena polymorpha]KAH3726118.1 hypothetical protein DPMN_051974 [Dreissena polymorpha]
MELLICYNKGCGSKYDPLNNSDDACLYHPGGPVFHDALKGWSCCKKRSTDFTEFLNFPGCTRGAHSHVKPPEPEKPAKPAIDIPDTPMEDDAPRMMKQKVEVGEVERPPVDEPLSRLRVTVTPSLEKALEKALQSMNITSTESGISNGDSNQLKMGTPCTNTGCKGTYQSAVSNEETCNYHPGQAIFHEGMKYWSCCQRKTSDFTIFLDQEGCQQGQHVWTKKETTDTQKSCRLDWFQTGPNTNISVFAKLAVPDRTYVEVNRIVCNIHIVFDGGKSVFKQSIILRNAIVPDQSEVQLLGTKVEVILRKAEAFSWPSLEYREPANLS